MAGKGQETVVMEAYYTKDTPKKHRYNGSTDDIDVGIYIKKTAGIPKQIVINLKQAGE